MGNFFSSCRRNANPETEENEETEEPEEPMYLVFNEPEEVVMPDGRRTRQITPIQVTAAVAQNWEPIYGPNVILRPIDENNNYNSIVSVIMALENYQY